MLYTFFTEFKGSTVIEQASGDTPREAIEYWWRDSQLEFTTGSPPVGEDDSLTPIDGLTHVWCLSGLDEANRLYLVHMVQTAT